MYRFYRIVTGLFAPLLPLWLARRARRGKEDPARRGERLGRASAPRPECTVIWVHGASVGEANSALPLIEAMLDAWKEVRVLLTTVTVTSAALMQKRLPERALHQFAPVDTPGAVKGFLAHWRPDIALFIDSELWPNLLVETQKSAKLLGLVNARISPRSFGRWRRALPLARRMLAGVRLCFAQTQRDAEWFQALGVTCAPEIANLKYDAPASGFDPEEALKLARQFGARPLWLAASTHDDEEMQCAHAHQRLKAHLSEALLLLVPRHAARGDGLRAQLEAAGHAVAQRSKGESVTPETSIYLADTMGELTLFYHLTPIAFIGGSLIPHGGQNPLEAARQRCAILTGPHTHNFSEVYRNLLEAEACLEVQDRARLAETLALLLQNPERASLLAEKARLHLESGQGATEKVLRALEPYIR
jgi:3-deoxy-D-manno-octulosonic-acid transferase